MQEVLDAMQFWATENMIKINKKKDMWICFNSAIPEPAPLAMGDEVPVIERVSSHKLLGVWHQDNHKCNRHVEEMVKKDNKRLFCLRGCRRANLPHEVGLTCYKTIQNRSMNILGIPGLK